MIQNTEATFTVDSWDEDIQESFDGGRKITHASVRKTYSGGIQGHGSLEYVMSYDEDGGATFVGLERVTGRLGAHSGSFVLRHIGRFESGVARAKLRVLPGSATGDLVGLRGEGEFALAEAQEYQFSFQYEFE